MAELNDYDKFKRECSAHINDFLKEFGYGPDNAPPNYRGKALVDFYVRGILADLKNLDDETIEDGLALDKAGDMGVDFVHKVDRTHHVYQSKFRSWNGHNSLTPEDVLKFFDTHRKITDKEELASRGNREVKAYFSEAKATDQYVYFLISNRPVSDAVKKDFLEHREINKKRYKNRADWILCDVDYLIKDWIRAKTQLESIPGSVPINFDRIREEVALFEVSDFLRDSELDSVLCVVKGTELKNLYKQHVDTLFSYNIRGFLGKNDVNTGIYQTLEKEPELFYFLNNGISAICKDYEISKGANPKIKCENFQIINGAQTVSVIGGFEDDDKLRKVRVLMRITSTHKEKPGSKINQKIIYCNNSQSQIKDHGHRANDAVQVFLEKKFDELQIKYRGQKPYEVVRYVRKRIDKKRLSDGWRIDLPELARALCAYRVSPVIANSSPAKLFDARDGGTYWKIFGEEGEESQILSPEQLNEVVAITLLWLFIKQQLSEIKKSGKKDDEGKEDIDVKLAQAKWFYLRCFCLIIEGLYNKEDRESFFNRIVKGKTLDEATDLEIFKQWFYRIQIDIRRIYNLTFETEAKGIWRNWTRNTKVLQLIEVEYSDKRRIELDFKRPTEFKR